MSFITDYLTGTEQQILMLKEQLSHEREENKRLKLEMAGLTSDLQQKIITQQTELKKAEEERKKCIKIQQLAKEVSQQNKQLKEQVERDHIGYAKLLENISHWAKKEIENAHLLIKDTQHSNEVLMKDKQELLTKLLQLGYQQQSPPPSNNGVMMVEDAPTKKRPRGEKEEEEEIQTS
jgi:hypothetical protein